MKRTAFGMFAMFCILLLNASLALGQVTTASILGTVQDTSNAVVAGVTVTVLNLGTGATRTLTTDELGRFSATSLPIGNYEVTAERAGFKKAVRAGITLAIGQYAVVDFTLAVGQVSEEVTVTGEPPLVQTTSNTVGALVDPTQMADLPLNGRNFDQLTFLTPGVQQVTSGLSIGFTSRNTRTSVAGGRPDGALILIDGANTQNFWNNGGGASVIGTSLGMDAIAEFETITNTADAEYGGGGQVVNAVTKSGTNSLHGTAFEYFRNSAMDARNYFDPLSGPALFHRNQFGVALGGPIKKNKTFFFANYEGLIARTGVSLNQPVPDANAHNGLLPIGPGGTLEAVPVDPTVAKILQLYPMPNGPELGGGIAQWFGSADLPVNEHYVVGKIDHSFSDKDTFSGRYVFDNGYLSQPQIIQTSTYDNPDQEHLRNQYVMFHYTKILSNGVINNAAFNFVRTKQTVQDTACGERCSSTLYSQLQSIPGHSLSEDIIGGGEIAQIGALPQYPANYYMNNYQVTDNVSWTKGKHSLKFGGEVDRIYTNWITAFLNGGQWNFTSMQSFLEGQPLTVIGDLPDSSNPKNYFHQTLVQMYIQDAWKVTKRLTVNAGLRYEPSSNPSAVNGLTVVGAMPEGFGLNPDLHLSYDRQSHLFDNNPSLHNFDPRVGFAWDVFGDGKTSLRGAYGIFHSVIMPRTYTAFARLPPYEQLNFVFMPAWPNPFANEPPVVPPSITETPNATDVKTPYMEQWNLNIERSLFKETVLTVGYVGSRGIHLFLTDDANAPVPCVAPCDGSPANVPAGVLYRAPGLPNQNTAFGSVDLKFPLGYSYYDSLQVSAQRRFSKGLQLQLSYTWAHSIDNSSATFGWENYNSGIPGVSEPFNINSDRGDSSFDNRHNFTGNAVYSLPFHGNKLVDGWQVGTIVAVRSGPPFTVDNGFDQANTGRVYFNNRPNLNPGYSNNPVTGNPKQWYNPAAFSLQPNGTLGDLGRNTLRGPALRDADFSVMKGTKLHENLDMEFRAEFFNIFNHANFDIPPYGQGIVFTGATGPNQSVGIPNPTAGLILDTITTSRQIQLSLRFNF